MYYWVIPTVIPFIALVCYAALLLITLREGIRRTINRFFGLYLLSMLVWSLGALMMYVDTQSALFWNKVMLSGVVGMPVAFFGFIRAFLLVEDRAWYLYLGCISYALLLALNAKGYLTEYVYFTQEGLIRYQFGPAVPLLGVCFAFFISVSVHNLISVYRSTRDAIERNRMKYALLGVSATVLGGATNLVPALGAYPIDIATNIMNALLLAYAIFRYQLLDIAVVMRKGLLYSIPTAIIGTSYFLIVFVAVNLLHIVMGYQVFFLSLALAAVTAVAVQPLRNRAQLWIDRLFFREKYDAQLMLQELSELTASILDIEDLTSLLLEKIRGTMHLKRVCIVLKEKETAHFRLVAQKGQMGLEDEVTFREDHPVVQWMTSNEQLLTRHDLDILPRFKALWAQEHEDLDRLEAELFVPLVVREELIGMLILGPKLSEAPYFPDEQLTLTTLANQTAVAIQNAWLYSDLEQSLEELKRVQAQLIQTEKLSAIGEMIAGVAHEINNPLTAVIGYSQLLQAIDLDPQVQQDLGQILTAGLRVKRIVSNLLDFSRQLPPRKEYVDINQVVLGSLELRAHELTNSNIQIETDLAPDLPWTMADRQQLQQVFVNIINNAQQAMAEKGGPGVLSVITRRGRNNSVRISFQDTGPGIPGEIMGRIFDPFFTTKEVGRGTGLGLSVSYGIVQEHEGRIWAESEAGRGATFFVELPIRHMASAHTQAESFHADGRGG